MTRIIKNAHALEWRQVKEHVAKRIAEFQIENESPSLDNVDTSLLRGQIAFAREILTLDQDEMTADVPETGYLPELPDLPEE